MRKLKDSTTITNNGTDYNISIYKNYEIFEIEITNMLSGEEIVYTANCPDKPDNVYLDWAIDDYGTDNWEGWESESSISRYAETITELGIESDIERLVNQQGLPRFAVPFVNEFLTRETLNYVSAVVNDFWWSKQENSR